MATIGINYKISREVGYESVYLILITGEKIIFSSGNFVKDWYSAKKSFLDNIHNEVSLNLDPTVYQFIKDGARFDFAYIRVENDTAIFSYEGTGWEMFVSKGTRPTWPELKEICKT